MSSISDDMFSRSRRRCVVKARSYLESVPTTEEKLEDEHSNCDIPITYEDNYSEIVDTEDIDEEPVTIDLSDFLNENALLTEPTSEHAAESGLALSDCHSQFRVTSSLADPSPIAVEEVPSLKDLSLGESITNTEGSTNLMQSSDVSSLSVNSSDVFTGSSNISTDIGEENIPIEESVIDKSSSLGTISKTPMGLSNAFQKFKDVSVVKELNKSNMQTFGKYPIVKCEKLNMESFVKKNIIKVGNWPLSNNISKSKMNALKNSPVKKFKSVLSRTPKLLSKPISFNKYASKTANDSSVNIVRSILVDPFDAKAPIDNSASFFHTSDNSALISESLSRNIGSEKVIKLVTQKMTPHQNSLIVPNRKFPIITSVNRMDGNSKTFKIISPPKVISLNENKSIGVTPILPKPVIETVVSPVLLKDTSYTVIEPYVEDPTSPVKLKPILTVPIDILPTVEGIQQKEHIITSNEVRNVKMPPKLAKLNRSVFLNGAIKQTSVPIKQRNALSSKKVFNQNLLQSENTLRNFKDINFEGQTPIIKAKSAVVAAMKSASSKSPTKRQTKSKQTNPKDNQVKASHARDGSLFGCQSYNNSLNDILFGFEDFTEESYPVDDSLEVSGELCNSNISNSNVDSLDSLADCNGKIENQDKKKCEDKSEEEKHKRVSFLTTIKRQKSSDSSHDSDTMSASEGGDNDEHLPKIALATKKKRRKLTNTILRNLKRTQKPVLRHSKLQKQSDVETCRTPIRIPSRRISIKEETLSPIPPLPDSISELKLNSENDEVIPPDSKSDANEKETSDTLSIKQNTVSKIDDSPSGMSLRNYAKETRTLRCKRKLELDKEISSINAKKTPDKHTSKVNQQTLVSSKEHQRFIRSRFKPNVKSTQNVKIITKGRKRLSRPSDIIQEIKTITSGNKMPGKGKKKSKVFSAKENVFSNSENGVDNCNVDLVSKSMAKPSKRKVRSVRPRSKKKIKTLKVLFKRSKQNTNPFKMQFDEVSLDLLDNVNETNSVPDNNSLNSTFRERKGDKTGSSGKDRNLSDSEVPSDEKSENPMKPTDIRDETKIISNGTIPKTSGVSENSMNFSSPEDIVIDKCDKIHNMESSVNRTDQTDDLVGPNTSSAGESVSSNLSSELPTKAIASDKIVSVEGENSSLASSENEKLSEQAIEMEDAAKCKTHKNKRKSCTKVKISKTKTKESVEPTDMKDWYVSERKPSTDSTQSEESVAKQNECVKLNASERTGDLNKTSVGETKSVIIEHLTDSLETSTVSKSIETKSIESCENPELSSATDQSKDLLETATTAKSTETKSMASCEKSEISSATEQSSDLLKTATISKSTKTKSMLSCVKPEISSATEQLSDSLETGTTSNSTETESMVSCEKPDISSATEQSSDLLETATTSKSPESCEKPKTSSAIAECKEQSENNLLAKTVANPVIMDSSISDLNSNLTTSIELPVDKILNTSPKSTSMDPIISDKSADTVSINNEIIDNKVNNEDILKSTDTSVPDSIASSSLESSTSTPAVQEQSTDHEKLAGKDDEDVSSVCDEQSSTIPIKKEPVDIEDSHVDLSDSSTMSIKVENEDSIHDTETPEIPTPTSTRKGRRSCTLSKKNTKSDVSNAKSSGNIETVNTKESNAKKKRNSKITKYFKKQSTPPGSPQQSATSEPPQQSMISEASPSPILDKSVHVSSSKSRRKNFCSTSVIRPFSLGWMRELVHRSTDGKLGKKADVYYFSPEGTKLRSMIEIGNYLTRHNETKLTLVNFTFATETIFREPFEIERCAKQKSVFGTPAAAAKKDTSTQSAKKRTQSCSPKKTPISKTINSRASLPAKTNTPKLTIRNVNQGNKVKKKFTCSLDESNSINEKDKKDDVGSRPRRNIRKVSYGDDFYAAKDIDAYVEQNVTSSMTKADANLETNPENSANTDGPISVSKQRVTENTKTKISTTQNRTKLKSVLPKNVESSLFRPCTPRCPVAKYQLPSVQCSMCLCLFHQNCIPKLTKGLGFACKSCVSAKLELYETIRNSRLSASAPELIQESDPEMPTDMDVSFLSPEINLIQQSQSFRNISLTGTSPKTIVSQASCVPEYPDSFSKPASISSNTVSNSPQLLSHLLQPQHSWNPNFRLRPASSFTTPPLVINRTSRNYLPSNCSIRVGVRVPFATSASLPDAVVIQQLPHGRLVLRKGSLATTPRSTGPIRALENLSQSISLSENLSSKDSSMVKNVRTYARNMNIHSDCITDNFESISQSSSLKLSKPSTSTDKSHASLEGHVKTNCDSDSAYSDLISWNMNRFLTSFECLNLIFKKLNACDLLRTMQVCKSWHHLSSQSILWEKTYFSNLTVTNWKKCCCFMKKIGTKFMDFSGVIHPDPEEPFKDLENHMVLLSGIQEVIFDQIPPSLLRAITSNMSQLRRLECHFVTNAVTEPEIWSDSCEIELAPLRCLGRLVKLKIGSGGKISLDRGNEYLMPYLPNLRHVSLTGFKFFSHINLESLSQQKELISLELGDCIGVEPGIYSLLGCLPNLKSLRLENGGSLDDIKLSETLNHMRGLEVLELMNFKIPTSLVEVFKTFDHLIHLNIWPDITTEAPLINRNLLLAMSNLHDLSYVCWGIIADGDSIPETLQISSTDEDNIDELTFEELFKKLVGFFPECRVEVKCVPRDSWREFCSTRR